MDIAVTGRHVTVSDRFRAHIEDKLAKLPSLAPRVQRVDVLLTHEPNPRQAKASERVEITCRMRGPVIRAEACSDDKYAALDMALRQATSIGTPALRTLASSFLSRDAWSPTPEQLVFTGNGRQSLAAALAAIVPTGGR